MFDVGTWLAGLIVIVIIVTATWVVSLVARNASIVDSVWSILFLAAVATYAGVTPTPDGVRRTLIVTMVTVWAIRLAFYITWRNWGQGEDKRYQAMRNKQGPNFPIKSLFTVFLLQGLLAWVVSLPLVAAVDGEPAVWALDWIGVTVWVVGFAFEAGGDLQLARFKADPENAGKVMNRGFWRYTRHPNYFGDFTQWWGFFLVGLAAGGWWALPGPLVMSWLLTRVSGVTLLERGLGKTKPKYAAYVASTNAFFPGPPKPTN